MVLPTSQVTSRGGAPLAERWHKWLCGDKEVAINFDLVQPGWAPLSAAHPRKRASCSPSSYAAGLGVCCWRSFK